MTAYQKGSHTAMIHTGVLTYMYDRYLQKEYSNNGYRMPSSLWKPRYVIIKSKSNFNSDSDLYMKSR